MALLHAAVLHPTCATEAAPKGRTGPRDPSDPAERKKTRSPKGYERMESAS
jgi:hypothetical protein